MGSIEISKAEEVRQFIDREDEGLVNLILSGEERLNACFDVENLHCPMCQSDTLKIIETAEGDSERVFFQVKCAACGCEFVLLEDLVNSCRRGIENAKAEIDYNKNKIKYFEDKLKGG